jgi:hypothetical protein
MNNDPVRFMFDIETLSTRPDALILSLGVVVIDSALETNYTVVAPPLWWYKTINRESQKHRHIDVGTVEFWLDIADTYPRAQSNSMMLTDVLYSLNSWLTIVAAYLKVPLTECEFWAKGTDFDFVILKDAYSSLGIPIPWQYNSIRDLRTVLKRTPKMVYTPKEENKELHNALGDAKFQAMQLIQVLNWERD